MFIRGLGKVLLCQRADHCFWWSRVCQVVRRRLTVSFQHCPCWPARLPCCHNRALLPSTSQRGRQWVDCHNQALVLYPSATCPFASTTGKTHRSSEDLGRVWKSQNEDIIKEQTRRTSTSLLFSSQDELEFRLLDTKSRPGGEIEYVTDARVMMYHVTMWCEEMKFTWTVFNTSVNWWLYGFTLLRLSQSGNPLTQVVWWDHRGCEHCSCEDSSDRWVRCEMVSDFVPQPLQVRAPCRAFAPQRGSAPPLGGLHWRDGAGGDWRLGEISAVSFLFRVTSVFPWVLMSVVCVFVS